MPQRISNKEVPRANFTQTPNIIYELGLSVYARDLYSYYRRVGDCIQCTKTISEKLGISPRQVAYAKQELLQKFPLLGGRSLISDTPRFHKGFQTSSHVEIEDIWLENDEYFKECLRSAQNAHRNDYLKDDLPRENASTDNISGLHHMQAGPAPYADKEDYLNKKASKLASSVSPDSSQDVKSYERYGLKLPEPDTPTITPQEAQESFTGLLKLDVEADTAADLAVSYTSEELWSIAKEMKARASGSNPVKNPSSWMPKAAIRKYGERTPCPDAIKGRC